MTVSSTATAAEDLLQPRLVDRGQVEGTTEELCDLRCGDRSDL